MLQGFFDASFTDIGGVSVLAGYVGEEETWKAIELRWRADLAYWEIEDFHLCDLATNHGHERAKLMVRNFGQTLKDAPLHGFYVGIDNLDWERSAKNLQRHPTRYHKCADLLFDLLIRRMSSFHPGEQLAVVLDRDIEPPTAIENMFFEYQAAGAPFSTIAFSDRKRTVVLQCADLIAGLVRRDWAEHGFGGVLRDAEAVEMLYALSTRSNGAFWSLETELTGRRKFTTSVTVGGDVKRLGG